MSRAFNIPELSQQLREHLDEVNRLASQLHEMGCEVSVGLADASSTMRFSVTKDWKRQLMVEVTKLTRY